MTPDYRIVGLVSSAKYRSLREIPPPTFYSLPAWTNRVAGVLDLNVRTHGDPRSVVSEVRETLRKTDSRVPIIEATTLKDEVRNSLWQERLVLAMTVFFGIAGLLLAGIALYGALAQAVVQGMRDIGIRMALGARVRHVVTAIGLPQFTVIGIGVVCGSCVSAFALRLARSLLYNLSPVDPISYAVAIVLVLTAALLAAFPPVLRAIKIDPASVLRTE